MAAVGKHDITLLMQSTDTLEHYKLQYHVFRQLVRGNGFWQLHAVFTNLDAAKAFLQIPANTCNLFVEPLLHYLVTSSILELITPIRLLCFQPFKTKKHMRK